MVSEDQEGREGRRSDRDLANGWMGSAGEIEGIGGVWERKKRAENRGEEMSMRWFLSW